MTEGIYSSRGTVWDGGLTDDGTVEVTLTDKYPMLTDEEKIVVQREVQDYVARERIYHANFMSMPHA